MCHASDAMPAPPYTIAICFRTEADRSHPREIVVITNGNSTCRGLNGREEERDIGGYRCKAGNRAPERMTGSI